MVKMRIFIDEYFEKMYSPGGGLDACLLSMIPAIRARFGLKPEVKVEFQVIIVKRMVDTANVDIELHYTASEYNSGTGRPFEPSLRAQKDLAVDMNNVLRTFPGLYSSTPIKLSLRFMPQYEGLAISFG